MHEEEGDAFLLHVQSGRYYGLNRSGLEIWKAVINQRDPVDALVQRWPNRSCDAMRADADGLISDLVGAGILSEVDHA